ncbi:bifunctional adenosylcobinamide kinase/adenosylcobinamide-phosphate guanylyltransferase [Lachnoclostridium sp. An169]|uniref:bifunctional adenosylcobinamide kinase/adenosylcobinamide-phosphate guanylyltransferase n=1 Tax=Lachnoclostridium sp. An169 TaxID=1965569 RepID=UPI0026BDDD4B|nr:bifunctional adenosylcobinamide kinase/adenosylcobinamide-phosphate guanylyltransferase [Lachnoclostridium sp. An169]
MKKKMELVIGGSGSGKSAYAESVICRAYCEAAENPANFLPKPELYYIADMMPYGAETEKKIENHRKMRDGKGFSTLEWYLDLPGKIAALPVSGGGGKAPCLEGAFVLLECVSNLTANEMFEPQGAGENTVESVVRGIRMLREKCRGLVVVTNDVFGETGTDSPEMRLYRANLAEINRKLAEMADQVTEVVCGVPVQVKPGKDERGGQTMEEGIRLVTGGAYQGKSRYAEKLYPGIEWADGATCPLSEAEHCRGMKNFHLFIRRWLLSGDTKERLLAILLEKNGNLAVVFDEIGCGLVPVDAFEREYREAAGRICTGLARSAVRVDRVVCGIGSRIR